MTSILISIHPKYCVKIFNKEKTIEVRKSAPKEVPFKAYIYQTKKRWIYKLLPWLKERQAKVIGEFICDKVDKIVLTARGYMINNDIAYTNKVARESCLYFDDLQKYLGNKAGYAWHISELKIYDEPKKLGAFRKVCLNGKCSDCIYEECKITRPPQSWQYVEELQ